MNQSRVKSAVAPAFATAVAGLLLCGCGTVVMPDGSIRVQKKVSFLVVSDPPGARIEADGHLLGIAPESVWWRGPEGGIWRIRATPAALDRPRLGFGTGSTDADKRPNERDSFLNRVSYVFPGTPASRMGLREGDRIIAVNTTLLPTLTGSKESAVAWKSAFRDQMSRSGFGGEVRLRIIREEKEQELIGRTSDQVEGVDHVQEKTIEPLRCNNQIIYFDMRIQSGSPIVLGGGGSRGAYPKAENHAGNGVPTDTSPMSSGTGFFITADGFLITNEHVVKDAARVRVIANSGAAAARVVKVDSANDLALLKAEIGSQPLAVATSRTALLGTTVATIGFPNTTLQGFAPKMAKGEVAALSGVQDDPRYFQISVPVQPGNSGGALVDEHGNVIGVVSAKLSARAALATSGTLPENVNYAVKSSLLLSFLESMPEVCAKLREPNADKGRKFEDVVHEAQKASALVLVY